MKNKMPLYSYPFSHIACFCSNKACKKIKKSVCAIPSGKKTVKSYVLRCLRHLLVMDSHWVTKCKSMAQTRVKRKNKKINYVKSVYLKSFPTESRELCVNEKQDAFISYPFSHIACFCSNKACKKMKKSVCAISSAKKTVKSYVLRCLRHLLVMDSHWVTKCKSMAQTRVKGKIRKLCEICLFEIFPPPRAGSSASMKNKMPLY